MNSTYFKNAMIPLRYQKDIPLKPSTNDLKTFKELAEIKENVKEFVKEGKNLLICSNNAGCGKTTWAVKILTNYLELVSKNSCDGDTPALFVNVNNFINEKKLAISDQALAEKVKKIEKSILTAKLVVFDDIADKSLSDFDMNQLYYWLDYRTANLKSCIFTTNQLPAQLQKSLSGKVYSRVVNYSIMKTITDGDHRQC